MFFRKKQSGSRTYLQIVENRREDGKVKQRVVATLGHLDDLEQSGQLDSLLRSGAKFAQSALVLSAHQKGQLPRVGATRIGAGLVFVFSTLSEAVPLTRVLTSSIVGPGTSADTTLMVFIRGMLASISA